MPETETPAFPRISYIIKHPSADLDHEGYTGAKIYVRGTIHTLRNLVPSSTLPNSVLNFVDKAFAEGHNRVELLVGDTEYKFYRKPDEPERNALEEDRQKRDRICYNGCKETGADYCPDCPVKHRDV